MGNKPIVHAPIATGSTEPRDIRDRFADFVNLKDFGAVGDGITDDSTAWAAWRTALQNGGMPYIPKGNYLLDDEVVHAPKGHFGKNINIFSYDDDGVVLEELSSHIYVSTSGVSTNDGLTPSSPVDITTALDFAAKQPTNINYIHLAGGTYNTYIYFRHLNINFILDGTVVFNKGIRVDYGMLIISRSSDSYTFSVNDDEDSAVIVQNSAFYTDVPFSVSCTVDSHTGVRIRNGSTAMLPSVSMTLSDGTIGLAVVNNSLCESIGDLTFSGAAYALIQVTANSTFYTANNIDGSNITTTSAAIYARYCSIFRFEGSDKTLNVKSFGYDTVLISGNSLGILGGNVTITNTSNNLGWLSTPLRVEHTSYCLVNSKLYLKNTQKTGGLLAISGGSTFNHIGTVLNFTGSTVATGTVVVRENSICSKNSTVTISGTVTSGKRYDIHDAGVLIFGVGATGIPGSSNGSVETATYSVYQ